MSGRLPLDEEVGYGEPAPVETGCHAEPLSAEQAAEVTRQLEAAADDRRRRIEAAEARRLANLDPAAGIRHGVHARMEPYLRCRVCPSEVRSECPDRGQEADAICAAEVEYRAARTAQVRGLEWTEPIDEAAIERLVVLELRRARALRYLAVTGEIHGGQFAAVARELPGIETAIARAEQALAIPPLERKRMREEDRAAAMGGLAALIAAGGDGKAPALGSGQGELIEGEFRVEEEGEGGGDMGAERREGDAAVGAADPGEG